MVKEWGASLPGEKPKNFGRRNGGPAALDFSRTPSRSSQESANLKTLCDRSVGDIPDPQRSSTSPLHLLLGCDQTQRVGILAGEDSRVLKTIGRDHSNSQ